MLSKKLVIYLHTYERLFLIRLGLTLNSGPFYFHVSQHRAHVKNQKIKVENRQNHVNSAQISAQGLAAQAAKCQR